MLVAQGMLANAERKIPRKERQERVVSLLHGVIDTPEYQQEFAKQALVKPLEVAKMAISLEAKQIKLEGESTVRHVIVVPETMSPESWNLAQSARKELDPGDWGIDLADTPFFEAEVLDARPADDNR